MVKRLLVLSVGLFMLCGEGLHARIPAQQKTRLNEGWSFLREDIGNIWEAVRPFKAGQPEEVPLWKQVSLPHCFNATDCVDPDMNYYQGPGWYKSNLSIANPYADGRTVLEFEGAGQKTDVYVYTTKVASHTGGYDSWNVDITDAVARFLASPDAARFNGKVPVSVRCDNSRDAEMIPSDLSDFNVYGGLYRYVNLVYLPKVSLSELHVKPVLSADKKQGTLEIYGTYYNPSDVASADVQIRIIAPDGRTVATSSLAGITPLGGGKLADLKIERPAVWDVDNPLLYTCELTVKAAGSELTASERFGFRRFEFIEKGPFHLNGRRLLLRGTHRHEDHAGVAAAMTEEQMRREMTMMKEMGVNFIRLGHYQQSDIILDLCDELGIVVWEEIPWCRGGVGGDLYRGQAKRMLTNMINQHYNHPAVIIWGLGNENDWPNDFPEYKKSEIRAFMSELNTLAHNLDPSRKTAIRRCDFCSDIVDVYSPTIWAGWYKGNFNQYVEFSREAWSKVKHFLHVEWGGDSHPGRHDEAAEPTKKEWSETYVVKLIDWHLKEQENMPWLTGAAYWPFKDFSTPVRPDNPVPYVNQKGVTERDLTKKESYYVFQSYWTDTPMMHILGHSQPTRWGGKDEAKEILVYSNCPEVELFVNGVSCGKKKRNSQDWPAAGLRWNVALREGANEVRAVATGKSRVRVEDTVNWEYQTAKWGKPAAIKLSATPAGDDATTVSVMLTDAAGVPCLDSNKVVRFEIAGDGELIKDLGTASGSSKVEAANGRASIKVKRGKGPSVVAVKSQGIPTAFITVE